MKKIILILIFSVGLFFFIFGNNVTLAKDIGLMARISPEPDWDSNFMYHYRTYYKAGDQIFLEASFRPPKDWSIPKNSKIIITWTLQFGKTKRCNFSSEIPYIGNENLTGSNFGCELSENDSGTGTLKITVKAPGVFASSSSNVYIINKDFHDLPVEILVGFSQRDWRWKNEPLGDCKDNTTIGSDGCATTSKAFIFNYLDPDTYYFPDYLDTCLTNNGGYTFLKGCYDGIPMDSSNLICAPSDVLWEGYYCDPNLEKNCNQSSRMSHSAIMETIDNYLESGFPVLIKTSLRNGGTHYVVVVGKREYGEWNVYDPWDGQIHMIEKTPSGVDKNKIRAIYLFSQR